MQFDSFSQFLDMGGYGFYVWLSFGSGAFLIGCLIAHSRYQYNAVKRAIAKKMTRDQKLKQAAELNAAAQQKQSSVQN